MSMAAVIRHQPVVADLAAGSSVPATGGGFVVVDAGAVFPRAEVAELRTVDGLRGVDLLVVDGPVSAGATFTPAEARRLAVAIATAADAAERVRG